MIIKKITKKIHDSSRQIVNEPSEITTYYFMGIPFKSHIVINETDKLLK